MLCGEIFLSSFLQSCVPYLIAFLYDGVVFLVSRCLPCFALSSLFRVVFLVRFLWRCLPCSVPFARYVSGILSGQDVLE